MPRTKSFPAPRLHPPQVRCLSIGVTLRRRDGAELRPAPERVMVAFPRHTFADLALAVDEAFGRWELGRAREFVFEDGFRVGEAAEPRRRGEVVDDRRCRLLRLQEGERFSYVAQTTERWDHECLVVGWIDPAEVLLDRPGHPVAYQSVGRSPRGASASG